MSPDSQTVDGYLAALPEDQRAVLQTIRETIKAAAPDAVELVAYGIPGFKYKKRPLIYFGAARKHCAIYGARPDGFEEDLKAYDTSKGTIRFAPEKPLPDALVTKLVMARMDEIEAGAKGYK